MSTHDDFNELEEMLGELPLREPSQMLDVRVASTLKTTTRATLPWLAIAAAVLLVGGVTIAIVFSSASPSHNIDLPITALPPDQPDNGPAIVSANALTEPVNLVWTRDVAEEVRYTPAGKPYRAVVRQSVDHRVWFDPETGVTKQITTPREELYIVEQPVY